MAIRECPRMLQSSEEQSVTLGQALCTKTATATEHGSRLIPAVSLHRQLPLVPLLQSMAGN